MTESFAAFKRLSTQLSASGLDDESIATIIGRLMREVTDQILEEISSTVGQDTIDKAEATPEKMMEIEQQFKEKAGISIADRREQLAEEKVSEFEALA